MPATLDGITTLEELRDYVQRVLCDHEDLLADQCRILVQKLSRAGSFCGLRFLVRGPRQVRLAAIWTADRNQLYFYDATGTRFGKQRLTSPIRFEH
ncbi:MAG: hypothetical protein D6725_03870 [Planctomycetota bacterium]|nr:MAG: hypothetical protein D6725_03870 [Planctomycetota bacterium]